MRADPQAPVYKESTDQSADEHTRQPVPAVRTRAGITGHNVIVYLVYV
jgi:hypothetical protein